MRHLATSKDVASIREEYEHEIAELWKAVEQIRHPASGNIAIVKNELEARTSELRVEVLAKIEKQDARLNGLILTMLATVGSLAMAIGSEYLKRFIK
jgi:uncharacterized ferritin-like protein (DUF455 family)